MKQREESPFSHWVRLLRPHTKTLLLAFAFDETHGYISQIASGK